MKATRWPLLHLGLCLSLLLSGCGLFGRGQVLTQDFDPPAAWATQEGVPASSDASAAARAMLSRFAQDGEMLTVDEGASAKTTMPAAANLRIARIVERYRVEPETHKLLPMDRFEVEVRSPEDAIGVFTMRRTWSHWEYASSGYPAAWWGFAMIQLRSRGGEPRVARLVSGAGPLSWFIISSQAGEFAFPDAHMGPVSIAPPGSASWERVEARFYPVEAVFSRIRWDGC